MPKRSLDDTTGLESEWIGRSVMLRPAAARGKRLPETTVATVRRVSQHATSTAVLLEYAAHGETKTYTDSFPRLEPLSARYIQVQEAAPPLDRECFLRQWCFQGSADSPPRTGHALSEVLPAFQLVTNNAVPPAVGEQSES